MRLLCRRWLLVIVVLVLAGSLSSTASASTASRWQARVSARTALLHTASAKHSFWRHQRSRARHAGAGRRWRARNMVASRRHLVEHRRYQVAFARRVVARHSPRLRVRPGLRVGGGSGGYALPGRIVACESGGDPRAVNNTPAGQAAGRPAGLYQIVTGTWLGAGGGRFAPTADLATAAEQGIIAARIWNGGRGAGQWQCK